MPKYGTVSQVLLQLVVALSNEKEGFASFFRLAKLAFRINTHFWSFCCCSCLLSINIRFQVIDEPHAPDIRVTNGLIEFQHVNFSYNPE